MLSSTYVSKWQHCNQSTHFNRASKIVNHLLTRYGRKCKMFNNFGKPPMVILCHKCNGRFRKGGGGSSDQTLITMLFFLCCWRIYFGGSRPPHPFSPLKATCRSSALPHHLNPDLFVFGDFTMSPSGYRVNGFRPLNLLRVIVKVIPSLHFQR